MHTTEDKPTIHDPREEPTQFFITDRLQLGEIIEKLTEFTGKADLKIMSFSVGEEFVRKIHMLKKKGRIKSAELVFDFKAAEKTARTNTLTTTVFDRVCYCANHAKVVVVAGEQQTCTVLTSQNGTRGTRNEAYFITNKGDIAEYVRRKLEKLRASRVNTGD